MERGNPLGCGKPRYTELASSPTACKKECDSTTEPKEGGQGQSDLGTGCVRGNAAENRADRTRTNNKGKWLT